MKDVRKEIPWQKKICNSLETAGGYGAKWGSEFLTGPPDLVCTLPQVGGFLIEVKHRPTWMGRKIKNPMTEIQRDWAKRYINGGALVILAVVYGSVDASPLARIHLTSPLLDDIIAGGDDPHWRPKVGFDLVNEVLKCRTMILKQS